jgi:hypothetical protein
VQCLFKTFLLLTNPLLLVIFMLLCKMEALRQELYNAQLRIGSGKIKT